MRLPRLAAHYASLDPAGVKERLEADLEVESRARGGFVIQDCLPSRTKATRASDAAISRALSRNARGVQPA